MKKGIIIAVFAATCLFSCKDKETLTPYYNPNSGDLSYTVEGLRDTTIEQLGALNMQVFVKKLSGSAENVKLNASGLPAGIEISFDPSQSEPSYNTIATIKTTRAAVGTYPISITGSSSTTGLKTFTFNLKVTPYSNAALGEEGLFSESHNCAPSGSNNFDVNIIASKTMTDRIIIQGFWSGTWTNEIYADLDPKTGTINIPQQTSYGIDFKGSGTYNENKITITYTAVGKSGTVNDNCTATITRK